MDLKWVFAAVAMVLLVLGSGVDGNLVFNVRRKFGGRDGTLDALRAHDVRRHGRFLSAVDLPLGGNGHPSGTGLDLSFGYCIRFVCRAVWASKFV